MKTLKLIGGITANTLALIGALICLWGVVLIAPALLQIFQALPELLASAILRFVAFVGRAWELLP